MRKQWILLLLILFFGRLGLTSSVEPRFRVEKVSERVILLIEQSPWENIIVAVAGRQGIVVIDSGSSITTAARAREIISKAFNRQDIAWVINTHSHWDHVFGNQAWAGARYAAHELTAEGIQITNRTLPDMVSGFKSNLADMDARLAALPEASPDRQALLQQQEFNRRNLDGMQKLEFHVIAPDVTFNDRMTIHLGDLTLRLIYFGRAHSYSDILIHIPEEGVLCSGDLFMDRIWLPMFAASPTLDVPRWIEVLNEVLAPAGNVCTVVPGHRDAWSRDKLVLWRDYIVNLWQAVNAAFREGRTVDDVIRLNPLQGPYMYLQGLGHSDERLKRFQETNIRAFWRQVAPSAVREIEKTIREAGIASAETRFREMRAAGNKFSFDEREMNQLAYELLGNGNTAAALTVLRMNVELFPRSANVYDSLGEALAAAGERAEAIRNYQQVLSIDPTNGNARAKLLELQAAEAQNRK